MILASILLCRSIPPVASSILSNSQIWNAAIDQEISANSTQNWQLPGASIENFYSFSITSTSDSITTNLTLTPTGWSGGIGPTHTITNSSDESQSFNLMALAVFPDSESAVDHSHIMAVRID